MSFMIVLSILLDSLSVYYSTHLKIVSLDYLPGIIVAWFCGPIPALIYGFLVDNIKFLIKPVGSYFIGYTLSEMLTYYIYAIFLYKKNISLLKITLARLFYLIFVVFGLNSLWNILFFGRNASAYFTFDRLFNNLIQFPLHIFLTKFLLELSSKYLKR